MEKKEGREGPSFLCIRIVDKQKGKIIAAVPLLCHVKGLTVHFYLFYNKKAWFIRFTGQLGSCPILRQGPEIRSERTFPQDNDANINERRVVPGPVTGGSA
ncbi:hypothetical protein [Paenibacillus sp. GM2]|uniref:hypothetical protein n=1 Tax=Paenibacillus sp. GM2 TaxID=1622070 RepID=UPI000837B9B0|nr:hypothetical protein [Paenibacillus sp. GM2]NWL89972.1 hypothetical protein [Paenibacillus sp. 79R4]